MRVRLLKIQGADLNLFEFDYDLTWAVFFMNSSGKIYGRFGGRDGKGPDTRNTLPALRFTMQAARTEHRKDPKAKPDAPAKAPVFVENSPIAKAQYRGCIHCHQVKEIQRADAIAAGTWDRESIYTYPYPENVGITLDLDRANIVKAVTPKSQAELVGIKPGDVLRTLNRMPVHSFADASYALHKAPLKGTIAVTFERDGKPYSGTLTLASGWRRTNITWRPSLLDMLPSLTVYGDDLTPKEKQALGLGEKRLAFRQQSPVHSAAKAMGVRENDIILGIDGKTMEMSMDQFLGHIRQNFLIGETTTLNLIRSGKRLDLKITLK